MMKILASPEIMIKAFIGNNTRFRENTASCEVTALNNLFYTSVVENTLKMCLNKDKKNTNRQIQEKISNTINLFKYQNKYFLFFIIPKYLLFKLLYVSTIYVKIFTNMENKT